MAADTIRRSIILFNREESGQLTFKEEIKLPFHPDNIEPVPMREGGEELFTIGVASFQEASAVRLCFLRTGCFFFGSKR